MYTSFFGLRELPFNNTPDPRFFYPTHDHEEALASLIYAVQERKGFVLLTGEVGAGKTLVSRMMLRHFGGRIAFACINHALQSGGDLLESICTEFELHFEPGASRTQLTRALHDFLLAKFARDIPVVLVVDEAQTMPIDAFEQVRMIGNLEADDAKLVQVAILGQPELQRMFASPALCQLRQRVFRSFHLPAMTRQEAEEYIRHRLSVAGATQLDVFDTQAVDRIYKHSVGIPRIVNTLCDNAMLSGYSANRRKIDGAFIESVIRQMMVFGDSASGSSAVVDNATGRRCYQTPGPHPTSFGPPGDSDYRHYRPGHKSETTASCVYQAFGVGSQRPDGPPVTPARAADEPHVGDPQPLAAIRDTLILLARDMRSNIEKVNRRLDTVEKQVHTARAALFPAADVHGDLAAPVERSRSETEDLARYEARVRKLAVNTKSLIENAGRIFDGLKRAAAQAGRAERDARKTHAGLSAQTERSRRLANKLDRLAARLAHECSLDQVNPSLIKEASITIADGGEAEAIGCDPLSDQDGFRKVLRDTHQSLADLNTLIRDNRGDMVSPIASDRGDAASPSSSV